MEGILFTIKFFSQRPNNSQFYPVKVWDSVKIRWILVSTAPLKFFIGAILTESQ